MASSAFSSNLNDHDRLRLDPLHALMAGKADVLGEDRFCEAEKGKALAAHSTLNRLELGALGGDARYKKIIAKPREIEALLIKEGVKAIPRKLLRTNLCKRDPVWASMRSSRRWKIGYRPIAMFLAVFLALRASQKHDGSQCAPWPMRRD